MKIWAVILLVIVSVSCNKEQIQSEPNKIPPGSTPFTDNDILFVPYTSESPVYKDQSNNTLTLNFKERKRTEEYYAWDQTYFTFSTDATLEIELRLRYLQSDVSKKTLALYMPYYDATNVLQNNLFEMPIDPEGIESSFYQNLIDVHDTLMIGTNERYNVYEVSELVSTDAVKDGSSNYSKIFYNRAYGILKMQLKSGVTWTLQ